MGRRWRLYFRYLRFVSLSRAVPTFAVGAPALRCLADLLKGEHIPTSQLVYIIVSMTAAIIIVV